MNDLTSLAELVNLDDKLINKLTVNSADSATAPDSSYLVVLLQVILMLGALFIFILWLFTYLMNQQDNQDLYINQELSADELLRVNLAINQAKGLAGIQANLAAIDWVGEVIVTKRLTDNKNLVLIDLAKAKPIARLANGDYIFSTNEEANKVLSQLDGPIPLLRFVAYQGEEVSSALDDTLTQLTTITAYYNIAIQEFQLSQTGTVEVLLVGGGMIKVGSKNHRERLVRLEKFLDSYKDRVGSISSIDLRYQKALAVLWSS